MLRSLSFLITRNNDEETVTLIVTLLFKFLAATEADQKVRQKGFRGEECVKDRLFIPVVSLNFNLSSLFNVFVVLHLCKNTDMLLNKRIKCHQTPRI